MFKAVTLGLLLLAAAFLVYGLSAQETAALLGALVVGGWGVLHAVAWAMAWAVEEADRDRERRHEEQMHRLREGHL